MNSDLYQSLKQAQLNCNDMLSVILYRTSFEYSILSVRTPRITDSILRPAWGDATLSHKVAYKT